METTRGWWAADHAGIDPSSAKLITKLGKTIAVELPLQAKGRVIPANAHRRVEPALNRLMNDGYFVQFELSGEILDSHGYLTAQYRKTTGVVPPKLLAKFLWVGLYNLLTSPAPTGQSIMDVVRHIPEAHLAIEKIQHYAEKRPSLTIDVDQGLVKKLRESHRRLGGGGTRESRVISYLATLVGNSTVNSQMYRASHFIGDMAIPTIGTGKRQANREVVEAWADGAFVSSFLALQSRA